MSEELRARLASELDRLTLVDPHTHIDPHAPAATTLADILGYHYYTELAHSAGMAKADIEEPGIEPRERVRRLVAHLGPLENTIQYQWLMEMLRELFNFQEPRLTTENWEAAYDACERNMAQPDWSDQVLEKSRLEAVFLTNNFDDPLEGFDTKKYVPCLRTDDLVFHLGDPGVRDRLENSTAVSVRDAGTLRQAIGKRFDHFTKNNARACAISLPPHFAPEAITAGTTDAALRAVFSDGRQADTRAQAELSCSVFWMLAELCAEYRLPFDLMIGVNRAVYEGGVFQGQDLFDSRVSLIQYRRLFNAFPHVTFPISALASVTNQELVAYSWIFPNVVTNGHWWYSNTPSYIEADAAARLEAVPRNKQIGYYSDMYKLEFFLPKFAMYKRVLAKILAERFVIDRGFSEDQALSLGRAVLKDNVRRVFFDG